MVCNQHSLLSVEQERNFLIERHSRQEVEHIGRKAWNVFSEQARVAQA